MPGNPAKADMQHLLTYLDRKLTVRQLLRLIPVSITLHNLEELPTMERWSREHADELPWIAPVATPQFAVAVAILTAASYAAAFAGLRSRKDGAGLYALLGLQFVFFVNAWQHLLTSLFLRAYSPGVASATLVNLPFTVYVLRRVLAEGSIVARRFRYAAAFALVLAVPTVRVLLKIGEVSTRAR